ncbi:MAG: Rrf2 family transcriptional regulator [Chloroflexi bacterium]|nr:Rrf2 family transcriptional regulator [Chloroflexota bacterium]MCL5075866.1 Rrf2 family transcriptional regulator [Chloroflexota bacterium]
MKPSTRIDYGVRAMLDLAQHYEQGLIQTSQIAARQNIPEPYLDQLLAIIQKSGLINSTRGPRGGHALARPPVEISLGEVIHALEGAAALQGCGEGTDACELANTCALREVWDRVNESIQEIFNSVTIAELCQRQLSYKVRDRYQI